jgi:cytochrome c biogenesis protein CcdA
LVGSLLGVVWSPCVGPTLGAATTLASQGKDLWQIAILMLIFGTGAAMPLIVLYFLSRATLVKVRGRLLSAGKLEKQGKQLLGAVMMSLGVLIATGADDSVEVFILDHTPDWLTALTTRF